MFPSPVRGERWLAHGVSRGDTIAPRSLKPCKGDRFPFLTPERSEVPIRYIGIHTLHTFHTSDGVIPTGGRAAAVAEESTTIEGVQIVIPSEGPKVRSRGIYLPATTRDERPVTIMTIVNRQYRSEAEIPTAHFGPGVVCRDSVHRDSIVNCKCPISNFKLTITSSTAPQTAQSPPDSPARRRSGPAIPVWFRSPTGGRDKSACP